MSRTFDTSPLRVRQSRATYRDFKARMLATDLGRRKNARALKYFWGFFGGAVAAAGFLFMWTRPAVHSALANVDPSTDSGQGFWTIMLVVVGLFFIVAGPIFTPLFGLLLHLQWRDLYATREFAFVNGLERHDQSDDDAGGIADKAHWRGLPFLQGFAPRAVVSVTSSSTPEFELGAYQYERVWFRTLADRQANTSKPKRETWAYLRIPLDGAPDMPRIVVRSARDLAPNSSTWSGFTYLEPYWQNPSEAVGNPATFGLFAPPGTERVAKAFFTPQLVALLEFNGRPLEAEVVGDAFYIYKRLVPWSIGSSATYRWLEKVLAAADVGVFTRVALEGHGTPAPTPSPVVTRQGQAAPLVLRHGRRSIVVTGPATPPDGDPGGVTQSGGRPHRP